MSTKPYDRFDPMVHITGSKGNLGNNRLYFNSQEAEWRAMQDVKTVLRMYGLSCEISLGDYDPGEPNKHRYNIDVCNELGDEN